MNKTHLEQVREIVAEQLAIDINNVLPESKIVEDLGADSLDAVELIMCVEEEFDIEITDDDAEKVKTVGDLTELVTRMKGDE